MEQLRVIGSEDDALVLATESGQRFTLRVDDVLQAELKRFHQRHDRTPARGPRPSPRDIQARVRAGLSTPDVAEALGVSVEDVERYAGPVLAEREHIVDQALAVTVLMAGGLDETMTFGGAVQAKLDEAAATGPRWTSWKDENGWVVKLEFTAAEVTHDARWGFDPRRSTLSPVNADATQLSRQGSLPDGLIPRLRALENPAPAPEPADPAPAVHAHGPRRLADAAEAAADHTASAAAHEAAIKRAPAAVHTSAETADLLEALRRRRGQREPLPDGDSAGDDAVEPVALFDALEPGYRDTPSEQPPADATAEDRAGAPATEARRRGRTAMPSWDEIVFGARGEDS